MPTVSGSDLELFAERLLSRGGFSPQEAAAVAKSLVGANLRGHDSHGVMRIPYYLDALVKGEVVSEAPFQTIRETAAVIAADGNWGPGQVQARRLMELVLEKAQACGAGVGTLIHSGHIGRLGEYCEQAAERGMVSMVMVNTHGHSRRVAPVGGKSPRLGTNPLAIGTPSEGSPLVLDFGTSATAEGKVRLKKLAGQSCPEGWLQDCEGRPTTDPNQLYADPPGTILPMGGPQAYKGFGLALMIEVLTGALSGGVTIREKPINPNGNCVFMLAVDPDSLGGAEHFQSEVSQLVAFVRSCPRIDPSQPIRLPGDPELETLRERSEQGIPFDAGNWGQLVAVAKKLDIQVPG